MTIVEKLMPQHYFANGLAAAQADQVSYYYSSLKDFNSMKDIFPLLFKLDMVA